MTACSHTPATKPDIIFNVSLTDEEKLQLVAKVSADAIYDWDVAAGLTRWNHGMMTLFGYPGTRSRHISGGRNVSIRKTLPE